VKRTAAHSPPLDPEMIALSLQQPWGELILRGLKTIEVRAVSTNQRGRIGLYVGQKFSRHACAVEQLGRTGVVREELPFGRLIGTVELVDVTVAKASDSKAACVPPELLHGQYAWHLRHPVRFPEPVAVRFLTYGVWFYPFWRRNGAS